MNPVGFNHWQTQTSAALFGHVPQAIGQIKPSDVLALFQEHVSADQTSMQIANSQTQGVRIMRLGKLPADNPARYEIEDLRNPDHPRLAYLNVEFELVPGKVHTSGRYQEMTADELSHAFQFIMENAQNSDFRIDVL